MLKVRTLLLHNRMFWDISVKCKKSYWKFLINTRMNGTFLVHVHVHLASIQVKEEQAQEAVEQNLMCYHHKHWMGQDTKHLIEVRFSELFRSGLTLCPLKLMLTIDCFWG